MNHMYDREYGYLIFFFFFFFPGKYTHVHLYIIDLVHMHMHNHEDFTKSPAYTSQLSPYQPNKPQLPHD